MRRQGRSSVGGVINDFASALGFRIWGQVDNYIMAAWPYGLVERRDAHQLRTPVSPGTKRCDDCEIMRNDGRFLSLRGSVSDHGIRI
jgi:hypothetical protein